MKTFTIIFLIIFPIVGHSMEYAPTDFYSRFSSFSYLELNAVTDIVEDEKTNSMIASNLVFVAFNYYCQSVNDEIKGNKTFEASLRHVYNIRKENVEWTALFNDPLQWEENEDKPKLIIPKSIMPENREAYHKQVMNFLVFLQQNE